MQDTKYLLKQKLTDDMKAAMRAKDMSRLSAIRMLLAAVKQREVDDRAEPTDELVTREIEKQVKQRRDSVEQYEKGGRADLAAKEKAELELYMAYLPNQMTDDEIRAVVDQAVAQAGVHGMAGMGKVMGLVRPQVAGKADMSRVSALVKAALTA